MKQTKFIILLSMGTMVAGIAAAFLIYNPNRETETTIDENAAESSEISNSPETPLEEIYTQVSMNVHDWVFPEYSISTLERVIDLHEQYNIPVDIYVTDPTFQIFVEQAPELIERFKTSPVVCISYHVRPPAPYYPDFDWLGFDTMSQEKIRETLLDYEEHALDLASGMPTDNPGGYEYVKSVMGYAPKVVGITGSKNVGSSLAEIYAEKGALFTVVHGRNIEWGDTQNGLLIRPEHEEVKLYESVRRTTDGGQVVEEALENLPSTEEANGPQFIGIKYHENNFYSEGTTFNYAFWENPDERQGIAGPPFDLSLVAQATLRSEQEQADHWVLYESMLAYLDEHRDTLNPINAFDLEALLQADSD